MNLKGNKFRREWMQRTDIHSEHDRYQRMGNIIESDRRVGPGIRESQQPATAFKPDRSNQRRTPPSPTPRYNVPKEQRVFMAIDVQNLYYAAKDFYNTKVAYESLIKCKQFSFLHQSTIFLIKSNPILLNSLKKCFCE